MINHPMNVNTNTRMRWEAIKKLPEIKSLRGENVLDLGAGLGFFSVMFSRLGANLLAVDVDTSALEFLSKNYNIKTQFIDLEKDKLPEGNFDLIFIGETLEHIKNPGKLLAKSKKALTPSGAILLTTPALEGPLIHTKGRGLGHKEGLEEHKRDGFYLSELNELFASLGMKITYHTFSIYTVAELFMQLTKVCYLKEQNKYYSQSDILNVINTAKYKLLSFVYPVLFFLFNIEQLLCSKLKLKGHCHILVARNT